MGTDGGRGWWRALLGAELGEGWALALRGVIGAALFAGCVFMLLWWGLAGLLLVLPLGIVGGVLLTPVFSAPLERLFGGLFWSSHGLPSREELSRPRALIAEHRYPEAAAELRELLTERPDLLAARALLAELLHERLNRPDEALRTITDGLEQEPWQDEHERLALLAADLHLERGDHAAAAQTLRRAVARGGRGATNAAERLRHLGG